MMINREFTTFSQGKAQGKMPGQVLSVILAVLLLLATAGNPDSASAIERTALSTAATDKIQVYIKPDVTIVLNGEERIFRDAEGRIVYPMIYNGSTYLPVRAISGLMGEEIEWDSYSKTIFIGKTLSNPNKVKKTVPTESAVTLNIAMASRPAPSMTGAYLRPNFLIMMDFMIQEFYDEKGSRVYPIVLNGSTYLPVRAVSVLMGEEIDWNGLTKTIVIGSEELPEPEPEKSAATLFLTEQFDKQVHLYDRATVKIQNLKNAASLEDLLILATEVSKDYAAAAENTSQMKSRATDGYTEMELASYQALLAFTEISEHYILVLENIAYMAAAEQDYSMLAETFLTFAMESQSRMDEARNLIQGL